MANDVGILTVARYLREGVGDGVRCFVDTKYGLREIEGFVGQPGALKGILKGLRRRNRLTFRKSEPVTVDVFLGH